MRRLGLILVALAACDTPSPAVRLRLSDGPAQSCNTLNCADVSLLCKTWISIRIIDPSDPDAPYLSQCQEVIPNGTDDLCAIARIDLQPDAFPVTDLEVQVALFPESMLKIDPETNRRVCPADVKYDAVNGFPIVDESSPAIGGRAFYRPGDETITVTLGCTDLALVNDPVCEGVASVRVAATVDDFDTGFTVSDPNRLSVSVGEPKTPVGSLEYELNPGEVTQLERTLIVPPAWGTSVDGMFTTTACLAVLDDAPQSTTALTCKPASVVDDDIRFTGVRLSNDSLDKILTTLSLAQFPPQGLTIGIVIDSDNRPVANQTVSAPGGTVRYLSADRSALVSATSGGPLGGVFVSTDAPFGTVFTVPSGGPMSPPPRLGGRVERKVTIVVLRFPEQKVED